MAEGARLESVWSCKRPLGSNPSLSTISHRLRADGRRSGHKRLSDTEGDVAGWLRTILEFKIRRGAGAVERDGLENR